MMRERPTILVALPFCLKPLDCPHRLQPTCPLCRRDCPYARLVGLVMERLEGCNYIIRHTFRLSKLVEEILEKKPDFVIGIACGRDAVRGEKTLEKMGISSKGIPIGGFCGFEDAYESALRGEKVLLRPLLPDYLDRVDKELRRIRDAVCGGHRGTHPD